MMRMNKRGMRARLLVQGLFSLQVAALSLGAVCVTLPQAAQAQEAVPSPESWFGFQMGADRKLVPYDRLAAYYRRLDELSDRMQLVELGKSTEGRPFFALFVSSPENLARLEEYRQMNLKLADPRGVPEEEIERIKREGKAVIVQSYDLHSTEIAAGMTAAEFAYELATRNDEEMTGILDNVIHIVMPSLNPDGHDIVHDWYMKYVGTEYEGGALPWLYQKYVGHDNNRDAFMQNMAESQHIARVLFREWQPEVYIDHHQMGQYAPRISIPPYADPIRPFGDPLVWREMTWYGADMAYALDAADLAGGIGDAIYSGWGHFGFHWITPFHNTTGMLTESASAQLATPLYVHPNQLAGGQRNVPDNEPQMNMPNPWPGGWWRPRDIVERQKLVSWSLIETASRNRERILENMYLKASRQTRRGAEGDVKAYIVDVAQHDPLTANKMINALLGQGVDVYQAPSPFTHEGRVYGAGSFVVPMDQPKMGVVRWLLGQTFFPDNLHARRPDGTPIRPYDMSTDAMTEFMGIESTPVGAPVALSGLQRVTATIAPQGTVTGDGPYRLDGNLNDSFHAVNLLLKSGARVQRVTTASGEAKVGDFLVTATPATARSIAATTGVEFAAAGGASAAASAAITAPRIGMLKRYRGGNMDEGWTRFLLESFAFDYTSLMDQEIKAGNLIRKYDVIVLPDDTISQMTGEGEESGRSLENVPPEYHSGFGAEGVAALEAFVKAGGKLVTFGRAGALPIQKFNLPVVDVTAGKSSTEFWSPGSTLWMNVDADHPLAYGMPEKALAIFTAGNQVYDVVPSARNDAVSIVASYAKDDLLRSGWLLGEEVIAGKGAMVSVKHGEGEVVLIGFRPQHRAQAHGTYKLVFDSLIAPAS